MIPSFSNSCNQLARNVAEGTGPDPPTGAVDAEAEGLPDMPSAKNAMRRQPKQSASTYSHLFSHFSVGPHDRMLADLRIEQEF